MKTFTELPGMSRCDCEYACGICQGTGIITPCQTFLQSIISAVFQGYVFRKKEIINYSGLDRFNAAALDYAAQRTYPPGNGASFASSHSNI